MGDLEIEQATANANIKNLEKAIDKLDNKFDKFSDSISRDFSNADKKLLETTMLQENQQQAILKLTENLNSLTLNVQKISEVAIELDNTNNKINVLAEQVEAIQDKLDDTEENVKVLNNQRLNEIDFEKEKTKFKYGLIGTIVTAVCTAIAAIVAAVI